MQAGTVATTVVLTVGRILGVVCLCSFYFWFAVLRRDLTHAVAACSLENELRANCNCIAS